MVERQLPKLNVAGSIPVSRSIDSLSVMRRRGGEIKARKRYSYTCPSQKAIMVLS